MEAKQDIYVVVVIDLKGSTALGEELDHQSFVDYAGWLRRTIQDSLKTFSTIEKKFEQFAGDAIVLLFEPKNYRDILGFSLHVIKKWNGEPPKDFPATPLHVGMHQGIVTVGAEGRDMIGQAINVASKLSKQVENQVALDPGLRHSCDLQLFEWEEKTASIKGLESMQKIIVVSGLKPRRESEKVAAESKDAGFYLSLAYEAYLAKDMVLAEKYYREAIRLDPNLALAHNNLGTVLFERKDYEEAEKEYREAIQLDPNLAPAHYNLSLIYFKKEKIQDGVEPLRRAFELDSTLRALAKTDPDLDPYRQIPEVKRLLEGPEEQGSGRSV